MSNGRPHHAHRARSCPGEGKAGSDPGAIGHTRQRPRDLFRLLSKTGVAEQALAVPDKIVHSEVAERDAEVLRRHILELVRFVDDGVAAAWNHLAEIALAHGGISAEQVMIDDNDVGLCRALPHLDDEAVVVAWALRADAVLGRC